MLAGLYAKGKTSIIERIETRDHTERLLNVQAELKEDPLGPYKIISVDSSTPVLPIRITVPGDLSSAVFFLVAAALVPDAELILKNVGINPTRTPILNVLKEMGMKIEMISPEDGASEPSADLKVTSAELHGVELSGKVIPGIIDEIPALAIAGAITGNFSIRDASELRQKESDRIHSIVKNLRAMGAEVYEFADGFSIPKPSKLRGASIESFGDHRITMAFAIAGLLADGITVIKEPDWVNISNPQFWHQFNSIQPHTEIEVV
jgi:3-phosphoshikimate 1-carboxyvinyltransferase